MNCREDIYPDCDIKRWECIPTSIIMDADNYYTKYQVDNLIDEVSGNTSGVTSGEVISLIEDAIIPIEDELNEKLDISAYTPTDLSNYYQKNETSSKTEIADALNEKQDVGDYATNSGMSAFTYDKATIDTKIGSGGTFDPSMYYTTAQTSSATEIADALVEKMDISDFQTYSASVDTEIAEKLAISDFNAYSADTASEIDSKVTTSDFQTYSGTVASELDEKLSEAVFQTYSAAMETEIQTISSSTSTSTTIISGDVATISGDVISLENDFSAHTANTSIHLTSGDVQSQIDSSISGKQDTLTAGYAISLSSDTVSFTLPISAGTGTASLLMSGNGNIANGEYSVAYGNLNTVNGKLGLINGNRNTSNNFAEAAFGQKNVSHTEDPSAFGHSGNTLFTVGNGIINPTLGVDANHNAFEIRANGDIYISDTNASGGYYEKPMIKLQDKPNVVMCTEAEWETISGNTQINTIYLIY